MTFPLKRLEKNPRRIVTIAGLGACVAWLALNHKGSTHGILWVWVLISIVLWCIQQRRLHRMPDLALEIEDEELRLLTHEHWGIDPIPLMSINGVREERASLWIHYDRNGAEKALELARLSFSSSQWDEMIRLLRVGKEGRIDVAG